MSEIVLIVPQFELEGTHKVYATVPDGCERSVRINVPRCGFCGDICDPKRQRYCSDSCRYERHNLVQRQRRKERRCQK